MLANWRFFSPTRSSAADKDLDAVVIQFTNTVDFEGYTWNLSEIIYNRIVQILHEQKSRV